MKKIKVSLKNPYFIWVGKDLLSSAGRLIKPLAPGSKALIITNKKIPSHFLNTLARSLTKAKFQVHSYLLPFGDERDKSIGVLKNIWQKMARIPLDRSSCLIALGGGVVGDVAGFAAATYMRGISLVHIPTTLLAQVDSAIGGKTAIDLTSAKNIVGAFYQPKTVISDLETLKTLAPFEFRNSFAEVIKYGMIQDAGLFGLLEKKMSSFLSAITGIAAVPGTGTFGASEISFLETVIARSATIKANVVSEDEFETKGKRMILNYGHTFAHALEASSGFKLPHGQAVAIGMMFAGETAYRMGLFSKQAQDRQIKLMAQLGLPLKVRFASQGILSLMKLDKKVKNGKLRFVLPTKIGHVGIYERVSEKLVRGVLDDYKKER